MARKVRLLRETVEIAVTEIKRFLEPRLMEEFQLRRVSAPLILPAGSPLLQSDRPGARVTLAGGIEVEIVGALDLWLRSQLREYDIAPGFGVYTVMTALRSDLVWNRTTSPQVAAWSWQQAVDAQSCDAKTIRTQARKIYRLLLDTEKMILTLFPHLHPTLARDLEIISEDKIEQAYPEYLHSRRMFKWLQPLEGKEDGCRAVLVERTSASIPTAELWAWNRTTGSAVMLADFAARGRDSIAEPSVGGNLYRDYLAMLILHQDRL